MATYTFIPYQAGSGDPSPSNIRPIDIINCGSAGYAGAGTLDTITRELTVTHIGIIFDGSERLWAAVNTPGGLRWFRYSSPWAYPIKANSNKMDGTLICSSYPFNEGGWTQRINAVMAQLYDERYEIDFTDTRFENNTNLSVWYDTLAANPVQVVYPLAEPVTYTLSLVELESVLSQILFLITYPSNDWAGPQSAPYGTTVEIEYMGINDIKSLVVTEVEGLKVVPVTSLGNNKWQFVMPHGAVGIAITEDIYYPVTITANEGGTTSLSATKAKEGDIVTFTATPNRGYYAYDVWANNTTVNQNAFGTYSFIMPNVAVEIHVVFAEANSANIVIEPQNGGIIRANPMTAYEGEKVSLSVVTKEGYTFQGVTVTRGNRLVDTTKISDTEYEFTVSNLNSN